ncbi:hypothetical protein [Viridibacillus arvi]|uniref:hypothetical protein n=1 Tax=Viridibacillus arvi TaxID=263475 RepID=UPI0034CFA6BD
MMSVIAYNKNNKLRILKHSETFYTLQKYSGTILCSGTLETVKEYALHILKMPEDAFEWATPQPTQQQAVADKLNQIAKLMNEFVDMWEDLPEDEYNIVDQFSAISRDPELIAQDFESWAHSVSEEFAKIAKQNGEL